MRNRRCRFQLKRRLSHFQRYFFQLNRDWSGFFQLNRRLLETAKAVVTSLLDLNWLMNLLSFQYSRNLVGQRVRPAHGAPNQLLMTVHMELAKQDGKRIQVPLTHAARTSEAKKLQRSLTQQALGHGSDHLQPTGPVLQTGDGCHDTVAQPVFVPPVLAS